MVVQAPPCEYRRAGARATAGVDCDKGVENYGNHRETPADQKNGCAAWDQRGPAPVCRTFFGRRAGLEWKCAFHLRGSC